MPASAPVVPAGPFGGFPKTYRARGRRIGWVIVRGDAPAVKPYIEGIAKLLRSRLSANHPEQYAIRPALEGPQEHLRKMLGKLRSRRDLTMKFCRETPRLSCVTPQGAFYAFPRLEIEGRDEDFVKKLLVEK